MGKNLFLQASLLATGALVSFFAPQASAKGIPKELQAAGNTFQARLVLAPVAEGRKDASPGLRALTLGVSASLGVEADGVWPNGRPVSSSARIDRDDVRRLLRRLERDGFFKKAVKYHSVRSQTDPSKSPPPAGSKQYPPPPRKDRHCAITLISNDERWYSYYEAEWDWGPAMFSELEALRRVLKDDAAKALGGLIAAAGEKH
jgi:hypothetical protein